MDLLRKIAYSVISAFRWALPASLKNFIKNYAELKFQRGYVKTFSENKPLFEEHFRKYRFYDEMEGTLNIGPSSKVLDVGCGISTVLHFVPGERYGIDPLAEEYREIYSYPEGIELVPALSESIPFDEGFFDVVFCTNVLDHVDDPDKTVAEVLRVLKPGGYFVLTVEVFPKKITRDPAHPHLFREEDARALVKDRFDVVMEKSAPMMDLETRKDGTLALVESANGTKELALLLRKP
jgi:SAM-dependent methyltransferase